MESILIQGKKFTYKIKRKAISSIRLRLISINSFTVSCPSLTPGFIIQKFIQHNINWILDNSSKFKPKKRILKLKNLKILGLKYQLIFKKTQTDSVLIFPDEQKIYVNTSKFKSKHARPLLEKKLRPFASSLIKKELVNLSTEFGFKYNHVTVRNQSSRFGSCSSHGNLNFNWQIIFFPKSKFKHILLHELTHLKIKNHSSDFWRQLTVYDPKCKANNLWLKEKGTKRFIF
jgi:predicted metal-dependent hydrolase